ncbi:hypothetical protein BJ165DRAFT_559389 [Panaeolus papilionaceus]|nr:hypothetical protein BJ165DRAFT_559389 [Panaeolus papilionaceus]
MEFEPGAGVFYLEHNQTKEMDPTMMNRNISCAVCEKYREEVEGSLKWCKGCEGVAYCSREVSRVQVQPLPQCHQS